MSKYHLISICNTLRNACRRTMFRHMGLRQPRETRFAHPQQQPWAISTSMKSPLLPLRHSEFVPCRTCCQPPVPLKSVSTESFFSSAFEKNNSSTACTDIWRQLKVYREGWERMIWVVITDHQCRRDIFSSLWVEKSELLINALALKTICSPK